MCPRHAKISPDKSNVRAWLSGGQVHFFYNLQLGLLKLQEDTSSHAARHRSRRCLSCWRAARCSWSRSLISPSPVFARRCWAIIRVFLRRDTIAGRMGTQSGRRFHNPSGSRGRRFCGSWNRLLCSMLVMFLRDRCWLVGVFAVHIQPAKRTMRMSTNWVSVQSGTAGLELTSHCLQCLTSDWQLKHCETFCSVAYIFKGHLNNIRKWLFIFENIIEINYNLFQMHTFGTQFFYQQGPHF